MKRINKINIGISVFAIIISIAAFTYDAFQNKRINKLQYDLNALNYKPIIKVDNILLTSFKERTDSLIFQGELNDSTGLLKMNSKIETNITFDLKNIGNTNARIIAAFCIDTVSGDDKLRELIYRQGMNHVLDTSNNEFYSYWQLQPNESDKLRFHKTIDFVKNETFAIHLLLLYKNDLDILYDSYYWAKFQKKDLIVDFMVDTTNGQLIWAKLVNDKKEYVKYIDQNVAYKVYTEKESNDFEVLLDRIKKNNAK